MISCHETESLEIYFPVRLFAYDTVSDHAKESVQVRGLLSVTLYIWKIYGHDIPE
jgi:hypothetical protein